MAPDLSGKTSLVTGASKGVGRGIALELARRGADVAVNYNSDRTGAEATAAEIEQLGRRAFAVQAHVGRAADVDRMFEEVFAGFERLDILVNNAGTQVWKPLLDLEESEWDSVIETNLKGNFLCTQRAARHMKQHGRGRIISIGSGCNKIAFPNLVSYTASKGGIEMFTKVAATELGPYGITETASRRARSRSSAPAWKPPITRPPGARWPRCAGSDNPPTWLPRSAIWLPARPNLLRGKLCILTEVYLQEPPGPTKLGNVIHIPHDDAFYVRLEFAGEGRRSTSL